MLLNKTGHKRSQQVMLSICEAFAANPAPLSPFNSKGLFLSLDTLSLSASLEAGDYLLEIQDSLLSRKFSPNSSPLFSRCHGTHVLQRTTMTHMAEGEN